MSGPFRHSPGCQCCEDDPVPGDCDFCNDVALQLPATFSGVVNSGCTLCESTFNGNEFVVDYRFCDWITYIQVGCDSEAPVYRLKIANYYEPVYFPAHEYGWFASLQRYDSLYNAQNEIAPKSFTYWDWTTPDTGFDCLEPRVLTLKAMNNLDPYCDFYGAEITIDPQPRDPAPDPGTASSVQGGPIAAVPIAGGPIGG